MSSFHNPSSGILSATTTFATTTTGVLFIPSITDSTIFRAIAYISYSLLTLLIISFIAKQIVIKRHLSKRR